MTPLFSSHPSLLLHLYLAIISFAPQSYCYCIYLSIYSFIILQSFIRPNTHHRPFFNHLSSNFLSVYPSNFHPSIHPFIPPSVFCHLYLLVHLSFIHSSFILSSIFIHPPFNQISSTHLSIIYSLLLFLFLCKHLSSIHLFIFPCIQPYTYLSIYLSVHPSIHLSIYLSTYHSIHPSISLSVCAANQSIIHLSIYGIHPSIYHSVYPSIHPFICLLFNPFTIYPPVFPASTYFYPSVRFLFFISVCPTATLSLSLQRNRCATGQETKTLLHF